MRKRDPEATYCMANEIADRCVQFKERPPQTQIELVECLCRPGGFTIAMINKMNPYDAFRRMPMGGTSFVPFSHPLADHALCGASSS